MAERTARYTDVPSKVYDIVAELLLVSASPDTTLALPLDLQVARVTTHSPNQLTAVLSSSISSFVEPADAVGVAMGPKVV